MSDHRATLNPSPVLGVSCIVRRDDRVLLVKRGRQPALGLWALPGGKVESGELLDAAVRREVLEETGLVVDCPRFLALREIITPHKPGSPARHFVLAVHIVSGFTGEAEPGSDATALGWFSLDEVSNLDTVEGLGEVIALGMDP